MYKILIIEDDKTISSQLKKQLEAWDYNVLEISDFKTIMATFAQFEPQLVLLDISLPFFNGYHWCNEIRKISKVPIIFISSASDNINIVMAVNMGGDDFIAKPFDIDVLIAKISALMRRTYVFAPGDSFIVAGDVSMNTNDTVLNYNDKKLELTKNEYRILQVLMENKGKIISRDTLMTKLWETDSYIDDNTLTVNINRLRKRLESIELYDFIKTKKGLGYMV